MTKGTVLVSFDERRRPHELPAKTDEFKKWLQNYSSIPEWPAKASVASIREVRRIYPRYPSPGANLTPSYNVFADVDVTSEDDLTKICTLVEKYCHVGGYI